MANHGETSFQDSWLTDPNFKTWLKKVKNDPYSAECVLCPGKKISIASMGRRALSSHMQGQKHKTKVDAMNKAPGLNIFFNSGKSKFSQTSVEESNTTAKPSTSSASSVVQSNVASCVLQPPSLLPETSSPRGLNQYLVNDNVTKAEILWCIQTIMSHKSMSSAGKDVNMFKLMFPDSEIVKKMELQRNKIGYVVVFGLAPHFKLNLLKEVADLNFVVAFDESLNKVSQRQQMDLVIRYWDQENNQANTRYLTSTFLNSSKASDLLNSFKSALADLDLKNMIQVSMDGPNVNFAFLRELKLDLKENGQQKELVDFGSCGIHTVHNAFKKALSSTGWDLPRLLRAMYNLFKDVPTRRGVYIRLTGSNIFPLKFCSIRWLENSAVAQRAIDMIPHLKSFVDGVVKEKCAPTCNSFRTVQDFIKDPLLGPKLAFLKTLATDSEPFLQDFQSNWPMAPFLHTGLSVLVDRLMERVVKSGEIKISADLTKEDNLLHHNKIQIGFATQNEIAKCKKLNDVQISDFRKACKNSIIAFLSKLLDKSPLKHAVTRFLTSLDPAVAVQDLGRSRFDKLLQYLVNSGWISGDLADRATHQYKDLCSTNSLKSKMEKFSRKCQRLDDFWFGLLSESQIEADELKKVFKLVLILSHGNAEVERGFSVNKECLQENLKEDSLVAIRTVYDTVQKLGGIEKVPITKSLLHSARNAHAKYKEFLEDRRKANQKENEEKMMLKRKKQMILELEDKRRKIIEEAKNEAIIIKNQILELEKK